MKTAAVLLVCLILGVSASPTTKKPEPQAAETKSGFLYNAEPFNSCMQRSRITGESDGINNCDLQCFFYAFDMLVKDDENGVKGKFTINKEMINALKPSQSSALDGIINKCETRLGTDVSNCEYAGCLYKNGFISILLS